VISALNLDGRLTTIPGVEVTGSVPNPPAFPNSFGHINAWPMPIMKDAPRDGAIDDEFVAPNWLFTRLRAKGPDVVVQYNHPRAGVSGLTSIGIFNSIGCNRCTTAIDSPCTDDAQCPGGGACDCVGYQPERPLTMAPNDVLLDSGILGPGTTPNPGGVRNLDFDVMEIANGAKVVDYPSYLQMRQDWFSLLAQNALKTGSGVSDSHRITVEHAGWSRSYVLGVGDDPLHVDVAAFDGAVKAGRLTVSAGPYVQATVGGGKKAVGPGGTVISKGKVRLKVDVRSPAWIPVDEVRVVAIHGFGDVEVKTFDATTKPRVKAVPGDFQSNGGTARFRATVPVECPTDCLLLVEAGPKLAAGPAVTSPEIVNAVEPDVVPIGFTNPIKVDVGDNGFAFATPAALRAGPVPGRMTGVTRAARDAAVRRGDHFPLYGFRIDPAAARAYLESQR
jgi:hypothetical protein